MSFLSEIMNTFLHLKEYIIRQFETDFLNIHKFSVCSDVVAGIET